ncbi:MAG: hypothetical protein ACE5EO_09855 [Candidatus Krumholzibacteriia bacterium]
MSENEELTRGHRRHILGSTLIVLGLVLFLTRIFNGPTDTVVLFTIGGVFLAWYLYRRRYGMLVPACILLGLAVGRTLDRTALRLEDPNKLGLGIGFVSIFVIDMLIRERSPWWPIVPGAILIVLGVGLDFGPADWLMTYGWPLIFVVAGLLFLTGIVGRGPRG